MTELPAAAAERVQAGHAFEPDPPTFSSVDRWTCTACGRAVLVSSAAVYGSATTQPCTPPQEEP